MIRTQPKDPKIERRAPASRFISSAMAISGYALTWIVAFLVISEYALRFANYLYHRDDASKIARRQVYDNAPWASEYARDFIAYRKAGTYSFAGYAPFTIINSEPFHSRYVNVDVTSLGALRRSTIANCNPPSLRVWAFGGSTTFGTGAPDDMTWPSYLVEDLRKLTGQCVTVENFGVESMVMNQELIRLIQALKTGLKPNLVVFYDGFNDADYGTYFPGPQAYASYEADKQLMDHRHSLIAPLQNLQLVQDLHLVQQHFSRSAQVQTGEIQRNVRSIGWGEQELKERAKRTLDNYIADIEVVRALAHAYDFRAYFFWQPMLLYGDKPLTSDEAKIMRQYSSSLETKASREAYKEAEDRAAAAGFVSLVHLFDETKACLFVDWVHLGPDGNRIVAARIASEITGTLNHTSDVLQSTRLP